MDDTVAAIATAPGESGIGIIRITGENSLEILKKIFRKKRNNSLSQIDERRLIYGFIIDEDIILDEVLVVYMKAPHTYTKEDIVEINCHGGMISIRRILELILKKGARLAEKGEFTKRAFLNGRIDLSQAEAVIDMISAKTDKGFDLALNQLEGHLSRKIKAIRKELAEILSLVIANIEYPDEDLEEVTYDDLNRKLNEILDKIKELLITSNTGKIIKEGLSTVIIGKPNVGKSSLLNALVKESRAIVTEIPGTTRDVIEEVIQIKGVPLRIIDTAGIRETNDVVEKMGVEKSKASFNEGDLIIFILNASESLSSEDYVIMDLLKNKKSIVLLNKMDLPLKIDIDEIEKILKDKTIIKTSIKEGIGVTDLENAIFEMVYEGDLKQNDAVMITNIRHRNLLERSKKFLEDAIQMIERKEALDFIEIDLRNAWEELGQIIGESIAEDIIDEVFSRFCLGK